ncbi:hypothetical protein CAOG_07434 [Capsaspora owczarzaki ATCC 30864]|uniref:Fork-head domain-containing protein n=1 Tax=Capsaspora owczarzaki (strain ATCC 30864) TaxID=595528 RepID=A0A0D2URN9_CAPO3|nr:hypothetical protein CAOG_07434 [Capsaspora owczarzaki ATCC 30864]KJE97606.1 hypothetical protein CAOG_007434 [Capsaspora owczarzaki ATCC 30864]|eukprot:XP_004343293.2 hypothetical protein CAOG_07434 [Capsaspora owczarzaki ATCC 30864]
MSTSSAFSVGTDLPSLAAAPSRRGRTASTSSAIVASSSSSSSSSPKRPARASKTAAAAAVAAVVSGGLPRIVVSTEDASMMLPATPANSDSVFMGAANSAMVESTSAFLNALPGTNNAPQIAMKPRKRAGRKPSASTIPEGDEQQPETLAPFTLPLHMQLQNSSLLSMFPFAQQQQQQQQPPLLFDAQFQQPQQQSAQPLLSQQYSLLAPHYQMMLMSSAAITGNNSLLTHNPALYAPFGGSSSLPFAQSSTSIPMDDTTAGMGGMAPSCSSSAAASPAASDASVAAPIAPTSSSSSITTTTTSAAAAPATRSNNAHLLGAQYAPDGRRYNYFLSRGRKRVALEDGVDYRNCEIKPPMSYAALIEEALNSTPTRSLTLSMVYDYIKDAYLYYRNNSGSWQNSIRHNLSLHRRFERVSRDKPGKGDFWTVNDNCGATHHKRRRRNKKSIAAALAAAAAAATAAAVAAAAAEGSNDPALHAAAEAAALLASQTAQAAALVTGDTQRKRSRQMSTDDTPQQHSHADDSDESDEDEDEEADEDEDDEPAMDALSTTAATVGDDTLSVADTFTTETASVAGMDQAQTSKRRRSSIKVKMPSQQQQQLWSEQFLALPVSHMPSSASALDMTGAPFASNGVMYPSPAAAFASGAAAAPMPAPASSSSTLLPAGSTSPSGYHHRRTGSDSSAITSISSVSSMGQTAEEQYYAQQQQLALTRMNVAMSVQPQPWAMQDASASDAGKPFEQSQAAPQQQQQGRTAQQQPRHQQLFARTGAAPIMPMSMSPFGSQPLSALSASGLFLPLSATAPLSSTSLGDWDALTAEKLLDSISNSVSQPVNGDLWFSNTSAEDLMAGPGLDMDLFALQ